MAPTSIVLCKDRSSIRVREYKDYPCAAYVLSYYIFKTKFIGFNSDGF